MAALTGQKIVKQLIKQNSIWSKHVLEADGDYFNLQAAKQIPLAMVLGCSDSRVPFNLITDSGTVKFILRYIGRFF